MIPANKLTIDEALLRELWAKAPEVTTEDMLRALGCSRSTLQLKARELGLPKRPSPKKRVGPIYRFRRA